MAVRRIQYDETGGGGNSGGDFGVDNIDNGGLGGGGYTGGTGGSGGGSGVTTNTYVFSIQVNEDTFSSFVNNSIQPTPKVVRITKESLAVGPKKIEVKKKGYVAQECYIISMIDDDVPIIDRPNGESPLGLNQKQIQVQKYIGDTLDGPARIIQTSTKDLIFSLNKAIEIVEDVYHSIKFNISGEGTPVSILKNSLKNAEFFPTAGETSYSDLEGTKYKIRTADSDLFRITDMVITRLGNPPKELKADTDESLEANIILKGDLEISITIEDVGQPIPELNPIISLIKDDERRYNINTKAGVPLLIQRNEDVKAITIIIGDDVLEFDDLGDDNVVGITIPENVFKRIGKYQIKLFPFSFEDYENSIREEVEEDKDTDLEEVIITPKKPNKPILPEEKIIIPDEKPEDLFNPYSPVGDPIINDGRNDQLDGRPNNEVRNKDIYR